MESQKNDMNEIQNYIAVRPSTLLVLIIIHLIQFSPEWETNQSNPIICDNRDFPCVSLRSGNTHVAKESMIYNGVDKYIEYFYIKNWAGLQEYSKIEKIEMANPGHFFLF